MPYWKKKDIWEGEIIEKRQVGKRETLEQKLGEQNNGNVQAFKIKNASYNLSISYGGQHELVYIFMYIASNLVEAMFVYKP